MNGKPFHIFLTGEKQVGKSTLVSAVLSAAGLKYGGLRSISVFDDNGNRNVFLVPAGNGNQETTALAGVCSNHHITEKHPEVFDDAGCRFLDHDGDVRLLVIDEIGNMERDASLYSDRIRTLLGQNDIRILGVVQKMAATDLADTVRKHPNVKLVEVNEHNRDSLVSEILSEIGIEDRD